MFIVMVALATLSFVGGSIWILDVLNDRALSEELRNFYLSLSVSSTLVSVAVFSAFAKIDYDLNLIKAEILEADGRSYKKTGQARDVRTEPVPDEIVQEGFIDDKFRFKRLRDGVVIVKIGASWRKFASEQDAIAAVDAMRPT